MTLKGKTLFITGASRGIGLAIALRAARDGANVAIAAKSEVQNPKLPGTIHTAAAAVEAAGGRALPIKCDIREEDEVRAAVEQIVQGFAAVAGHHDLGRHLGAAEGAQGQLHVVLVVFHQQDELVAVHAIAGVLCSGTVKDIIAPSPTAPFAQILPP